MEAANIKEYDLLRKEMNILKDCVTSYMGFTIGGSGLAFAGFAGLSKSSIYTLYYVPLFLGLLISLVLLVLFYKFNSHNRYAGYCKLLNQERFKHRSCIGGESETIVHNKENVNPSETDIMAWEICVDQLRASEMDRVDINTLTRFLSKEINMDYENEPKLIVNNIDYVSGHSPTIDQKSLYEMLKTIICKGKNSYRDQINIIKTELMGLIHGNSQIT